jgi:hypothetical protein
MVLRFIFHHPETTGFDGDLLDAGELGEVAVTAERSGFDGLSLSEHPVPGAEWLRTGGHPEQACPGPRQGRLRARGARRRTRRRSMVMRAGGFRPAALAGAAVLVTTACSGPAAVRSTGPVGEPIPGGTARTTPG